MARDVLTQDQPTRVQVGENMSLFEEPGDGDVMLDGNTPEPATSFSDVYTETEKEEKAAPSEQRQAGSQGPPPPQPPQYAPDPSFTVSGGVQWLSEMAKRNIAQNAVPRMNQIQAQLARLGPDRNFTEEQMLGMTESQKAAIYDAKLQRERLRAEGMNIIQNAQMQQQVMAARTASIQNVWENVINDPAYRGHGHELVAQAQAMGLPADQLGNKETYRFLWYARRGIEQDEADKRGMMTNQARMAGGGARRGGRAQAVSGQEKALIDKAFGKVGGRRVADLIDGDE